MSSIQNEIHYVAAWQILRQLLYDGYITKEEYAVAQDITVRQYQPLAVRE